MLSFLLNQLNSANVRPNQNMTLTAELYSMLIHDAISLQVTPDSDTVVSTCSAKALSIFLTTGYRDLVPPLVCINDHMFVFITYITL